MRLRFPAAKQSDRNSKGPRESVLPKACGDESAGEIILTLEVLRQLASVVHPIWERIGSVLLVDVDAEHTPGASSNDQRRPDPDEMANREARREGSPVAQEAMKTLESEDRVRHTTPETER